MPPIPLSSRSFTALIIVASLCIAAVATSAASLAITRASWNGETLYVSGTSPGGQSVTIANAATGVAIGTAKVENNGRWKAVFENLARVPCRVRATQGTAGVERAVSGAPSSCDGGTTKSLTSLSITGPATVLESSSATYAATASFSDGTTQNVTATATWSDSSSYASIAAGVLTTTAVPSDQSVIVDSSFTSGSVTRTATLSVTVQNAPEVTGSHAGRFTTFEGTKTCLGCHRDEAIEFHGSVHYQWTGNATESGISKPAGKLGGINDFCIYPDINWLGKMTTVDGRTVDGGCARCHTGLGKKPTATLTPSTGDLENIDCLICHSPSYKRMLAPAATGGFTFVPDTTKMTVTVLQAAVDLRKPDKLICLNCHTKAGGGDNFKRGDISEAHRAATTALDVHMAPSSAGGAGLECTSCHTAAGHRIAGRGVDMRQRDSSVKVECSNCHTLLPHDDSRLNTHTARVACNVCHVPTFAKGAPTDMRRDWSVGGELNAETKLYEPHMVLQSNVMPVYRFFNGRSKFYEFATPVVPQANGKVLMAGPLGSRTESGAKITAMKRHEGLQPIDPVTRYLLPLKIGLFFQTGDIVNADVTLDSVRQGVAGVGWAYNGYGFAETERFMGIYHEVAPASQALSCSSCHGGTRLNFAALGYTPLTTRNGKPLCSSCHGAKPVPSFTTLHQKHVTDKQLDCISCHTFSKG